MRNFTFITLLSLAALGGCETTQPMTATQLDALQVREVEVPADRAFAAASSALFDAGYQIHVSDADAGLLTAERREDPSVAANATLLILTAILTRGGGAQDKPPDFYAICIEVLPDGPDRSAVRIRPFLNGQVQSAQNPAARKTVGELWTLMQRQVLMKEPTK
ncbi:MAG: hypothetical protein KF805_13275 [Phycisphaeraceae bacterium]|nr:hypothetical protein [Phycisphaeraceae bacterium]